ncbi:MAG TPA: hypothetical protein VNK05_10255 [Chloroflexota bacterium]|nr:hypothetical protein [Chloroflexota bacterium]
MTAGAAPAPAPAVGDRRLRPLRLFLLLTGIALTAQGALSLALAAAGAVLPDLAQAFVADPRHATLHVLWGLVVLVVLGTRYDDARTLTALTLLFGVFYTALAFLGLFVFRPFGLHLGPGENVFHFVVGPAALATGWSALRRR